MVCVVNKEYDFFMQSNLTKHIGNWIAIVDDQIVASGKDVKGIYAEAKKKYPLKRPLLTRVPNKETMIL